MKKISFCLILVFILVLNSCGLFYKVKVTCREYKINDEEYWSPLYTGNIISYVNQKNEEKQFILENKTISHTKNYKSDTGCSCYNESKFELQNDSESISFYIINDYIFKNPDNISEHIFFKINGKVSVFNENDFEYLNEFEFAGKILKDAKIYKKEGTGGIYSFVLARGIGLIQFELVDGTVYKIKKIKDPKKNYLMTFKFEINDCEFQGTKSTTIHFKKN